MMTYIIIFLACLLVTSGFEAGVFGKAAPSFIYFLSTNSVGIIALAILFYRLTKLMEDYHNFMYQRTKKQLIWFLAVNLFICVISIILIILEWRKEVPGQTRIDFSTIFRFCHDHDANLHVWAAILVYIKYIGMFNMLLLQYAVIFIKSDEDLIERINKLNDLIKCSIFQRYRDKSKNAGSRKESKNSTQTVSSDVTSDQA